MVGQCNRAEGVSSGAVMASNLFGQYRAELLTAVEQHISSHWSALIGTFRPLIVLILRDKSYSILGYTLYIKLYLKR
jgi:hypothetical protein